MKKLVSLFLAVLMLTSLLAGCTKAPEKEVDKPVNQEDGQPKEEKVIKTLTMFSSDTNPNYDEGNSPVAQRIAEATGIKLEIEYPLIDVKERIGLMIGSGEYPDIIFAKTEEMAMLVDAGAYLDLTDLIEEHGPNLKKLYGEYMPRLRYSATDHSIYALSSTAVDAARWEPSAGFELQHAVVKELGYPKLETVKDFENAIRTYMDKYPTIDGQPTIGLSLLADDWRWLISLGNPAGQATGIPDDGNWYIDPDTYEAKYRFLRDEEKEYFRWLNHMYNEGLLDPDSFTQKYDAYIAKIASGRVLGLIDAKWEYQEGENVLKSEGKFDRTYGMYPIQMDDSTISAEFRDYGYLAGYGVGITTKCEDPVAAIKFLDYMASEEGQVLRYWGVEGDNYTMENGKRVMSAEEWDRRNNDQNNYGRETGVMIYGWPFPSYGIGKEDSTGNTYQPDSVDTIINRYSDIEKEVLNQYGATMWKDLYPTGDQLPKSAWGAAFLINIPTETGIPETLTRCDAVVRTGLVEAIIAKPDKFDEVWSNIMVKLEREGVHEMGEKFTALVKAQIEQWK